MRPDLRLSTAIVIIGICGFALVRGWDIVHFSLAMAHVDSAEKQAEITSSWGSAPDVASAAFQADLKDRIDFSDPIAVIRRREVLSLLLSIRPLSSGDWLSLAHMQLIARQPMEEVLGSLKMSVLTGPNEGYVMAERGVFGVSLWESLSPDLKSHVAIDMVPALFPRSVGERNASGNLRAVLSAKPEPVRREIIEEAILATGFAKKDIEKQLGY